MHNTWVIVDAEGLAETRGKVKPKVSDDGSVSYRVCKKYYVNKASPDFRWMIVFLEGMYNHWCIVYMCVWGPQNMTMSILALWFCKYKFAGSLNHVCFLVLSI